MQVAGYADIAPLASGAASDLFRARQLPSNRQVALKVFRFALADDRAERRYLRDFDAARLLSDHPHVATLYDAGLAPERRPYVAMELAPGGSVADRLADGPIPPRQALSIGLAAAEALDAAHRIGMVHRFLRPTGVLFGTEGRVIVAEVGIRLAAERWDTAEDADRAPVHAAPEELERRATGPPADVYSLASIVYTMLAGQPPRRAEGPDAASVLLLQALQTEVPPLPGDGLPPELEAVLRAGLAPDPRERTRTVKAFADQLRALIDQVPEEPQLVPERGTPAPEPDQDVVVTVPGLGDLDHRLDQELRDEEHRNEEHRDQQPVDAPLDPDDEDEDEPHYEDLDELLDQEPDDSYFEPLRQPVATESGLEPEQGLVPIGAPEPAGVGALRGRAGRLAAAGAAVALTFVVLVLRTGDGDSSDGDTDPAPSAAEDTTDDGSADDTDQPQAGLEVPTGLRAFTSAAGVSLEWDESDTEEFAVMILAEDEAPRIRRAEAGPSLLIPFSALHPDGGYCFLVARLDTITELIRAERDPSGPDGDPLEDLAVDAVDDQAGPAAAFSSPSCIGGADEDTVITE